MFHKLRIEIKYLLCLLNKSLIAFHKINLISNKVFFFFLLFTFSSLTISLYHVENDNKVQAFKPTISSDLNQQQLQEQQQQSNNIQSSNEYVFVRQWGSGGNGTGQYASLDDIAIDSKDNVYVADAGNYRIQKFDSDGNFITMWGDKGRFERIAGIDVDSEYNVYVVDEFNHNIQKFDSNGNFITKWGSHGSGTGQFNGPRYITIDSLDKVYVADFNNHRIQVFAPK